METIRYILYFSVKLAIFLIFVVLIWWFIATFFPTLSVKSLFFSSGTATSSNMGWLPAPGSIGGLFGKAKTPSETNNVYNGGDSYNGYGNAYNNNYGGAEVQFITYTSTGTQIISGTNNKNKEAEEKTVNGYSKKELYIRNLSIYEKGHVYTGLSFIGEAKNTMFQSGKFKIIIADMSGRVVGIDFAEATTNWSVPGWTRFQAKINSILPYKVPCTMIFEQETAVSQQYTYSNTKKQPARIAIPVLCN